MAHHLELTAEKLDFYLGEPISRICPLHFGTVGDQHNHCAHFVGHALKLNHQANVGTTCAAMTYDGRRQRDSGACIRVNELFNRCTQLEDADPHGCIVYITTPGNLTGRGTRRVMGQHPRKHVGIYLDGEVWHYSNSRDRVVRQSIDEFSQHYSGNPVMAYTAFPKAATFVPFTAVEPPAPRRSRSR